MVHSRIETSDDIPRRTARARSLPSRLSFDVAVALSIIHYLGIIASCTAVVQCLRYPSPFASHVFVGSLIFTVVAWAIGFFKRKTTFCPLCKGTPLINSGAETHKRAKRIFPLNHGVSSTLSIIATQRFRCMYCGSDFDLLKPPSRLQSSHSRNSDEDDPS